MIKSFSLKYCVWLVVAALFMGLAGCKAKKEAIQPRVISTKETRKAFRTLSMKKTEFTIETSSNKSSLNGTMRIARDSMIFCTIMPFPGMEFARLKVDEHGVTIIDRIGKRYLDQSFADLKSKYGLSLDYNAFEAILTNRLFIYGSSMYPNMSDFKSSAVTDTMFKSVDIAGLTMLQRSDNSVSQEFYLDSQKKVLSGKILTTAEGYFLEWNYSQFSQIGQVWFPSVIDLTFSTKNGKKTKFRIKHDGIELDSNKNFEFKVPESYQKVEMEEIIQLLG